MDIFDIFSLWREIGHLAAFTGLGLAGLAGCAAALWWGAEFPLIRHAAVLAIGAIVGGYVLGIYCYSTGRADCQAEREAEKKAAAAAVIKRDDSAAQITAATFDPIAAILAKDETGRQLQVDKNAKAFSAGNCRIGPDALRLRGDVKSKSR